jgi:hypothetical protein
MESRQVIESVKSQLAILKKEGHEAVSIEGLEAYLEDLSAQATSSKEIQLAQYNAQHQSNIEQYKESKAEWRELFKATIGHAQSAIKLQAIVNGGAAVALLAFIGKVWTPEFNDSPIAAYIPFALVLYCCGVGAAAVTQSLTYLSQHFFTYDGDEVARIIRFFAQLTAFSSLVLFFVATYVAYLGFVRVPGQP